MNGRLQAFFNSRTGIYRFGSIGDARGGIKLLSLPAFEFSQTLLKEGTRAFAHVVGRKQRGKEFSFE